MRSRSAAAISTRVGNFFTIRDILERYDSEVLRFFLLSAHYRSPIDFSDQNLADAEAGLDRIYSALAGMEDILARSSAATTPTGDTQVSNEAVDELAEKVSGLHLRFCEAMDDDFNTALAVSVLFGLTKEMKNVRISVFDNGIGFDQDQIQQRRTNRPSLGLAGMEERAALLGGTVTVQSRSGYGTEVEAKIPYHHPEDTVAAYSGTHGKEEVKK